MEAGEVSSSYQSIVGNSSEDTRPGMQEAWLRGAGNNIQPLFGPVALHKQSGIAAEAAHREPGNENTLPELVDRPRETGLENMPPCRAGNLGFGCNLFLLRKM